MGAVAIPAMKKYRYFPTLSAGAVAAGSTLGVMIPPSIVLVVYGLYTSQSIGKLFFGVVIPGLTLAALMAATVSLICLRHPDWGPPSAKASWGERFRALPGILDVVLLFFAIMFALLGGKVTATEAAAASSFLALVICLARRKLDWKRFKGAVYDTLRISCMVFMIVAGATVFGRFMAVTRLPYEVAAWIGESRLPGWTILLMMLGCYAIGGCIMDALAFLLISLPIFFPLAEKIGYDPVWFGVVLCLITTLGAITPPVGICCFVVAGMNKDIPLRDVFKGSMYYIPAYVVALALLMLFPKFMVSMLADMVR
jgi:tripartite ATP-independent transporter DctM subunit